MNTPQRVALEGGGWESGGAEQQTVFQCVTWCPWRERHARPLCLPALLTAERIQPEMQDSRLAPRQCSTELLEWRGSHTPREQHPHHRVHICPHPEGRTVAPTPIFIRHRMAQASLHPRTAGHGHSDARKITMDSNGTDPADTLEGDLNPQTPTTEELS